MSDNDTERPPMTTETVVIERFAEAVVRRFQTYHVCKKEAIIAEIEAKAEAAKENSVRLESALARMADAVTANAKEIAVVQAGQEAIVIKSERKMMAIILSLLGGGAGGVGIATAVSKLLGG
jgi:hypothetical protein